MTDHPSEAQQNLKRIVICDDSYLDVFPWLPPANVGLELALVSCRFDALVDAHFRLRRWTLGKLTIDETKTSTDAEIVKMDEDESSQTSDEGTSMALPIPQTPLPNGVVGFERINCRYIIDDVAAFFQRIGRLLQSDITLEFGSLNTDEEIAIELFHNVIWPLLNSSVSIVKMSFEYPIGVQRLRRLISPSVLRECANLRQITFTFAFLLHFPAEDSAGAYHDQALCKWLHTPLADGRPKVLRTNAPLYHTTTEKLTTEFLRASTGVNFIIVSSGSVAAAVSQFEEKNFRTNERLTMRTIGFNWWIVVRSPIDKNADQWAEWERQAFEEDGSDWKVLKIDV